VAAGRLDHDPYPDLVVVNITVSDWPGNQVYFYSHPRSFSGPYTLESSEDLYSNDVKLAYLDDDRYLDLLIANGQIGGSSTEGQKNSLYINNGDRTFTNRSDLLPSRLEDDREAPTSGVDAADLDRDGLVDVIVFANSHLHSLLGRKPIMRAYYIHREDASLALLDLTEPLFSFGETSFDDDTQAVAKEDYQWGVAFGDVDGDQMPELFVSSDGQNRLLKNLYRTLQ